MTAGDAYAASPGSTHTDFAVDTGCHLPPHLQALT